MLAKFTYRSFQPEMLDEPGIPAKILHSNLAEIVYINKKLGGYSTTISGLKKLISDKNRTYHIADIGCGAGDTLLEIAKWAKRNQYSIRLTGIDFNPDAIDFAKRITKAYPAIEFICADYTDYLNNSDTIDICLSTLFCHHLNDIQFQDFIHKITAVSKSGFVINDLHRYPLAYYSIKALTSLISKSELTKNDAPLSVLRGFKRKELEYFFSFYPDYKIEINWKWAFRYLITGVRNHGEE